MILNSPRSGPVARGPSVPLSSAFRRLAERARSIGSADPIDPDVGPDAARPPARILVAIGAGGVVGAVARYELASAWAARPGSFPWSTLLTNVTGSLALGVLFTLIVERWPPRRYLRPFVATGVIGAYTTWSTFMVDADDLLRRGRVGLAAAYVTATLVAGLAAVYSGMLLVRLIGVAGDHLEEPTP